MKSWFCCGKNIEIQKRSRILYILADGDIKDIVSTMGSTKLEV